MITAKEFNELLGEKYDVFVISGEHVFVAFAKILAKQDEKIDSLRKEIDELKLQQYAQRPNINTGRI